MLLDITKYSLALILTRTQASSFLSTWSHMEIRDHFVEYEVP